MTKSTPCVKDGSVGSHQNGITNREAALFLVLFCVLVVWGMLSLADYIDSAEAKDKVVRLKLSTRLIGAEGLDLGASPPASPAFRIAIDMSGLGRCYRACNKGGGKSMLRVSYHGMILAWGQVPPFCIQGRWSADDVVTVEAKAEAAVLREEVRGMVRSELHVMGRAEFGVEGEVAGLGYVRCKAFLLDGKIMDDFNDLCHVDYSY